MRKTSNRPFGFFNLRVFVAFALCFLAIVFALSAIDNALDQPINPQIVTEVLPVSQSSPQELSALRTAHSFEGNLGILPFIPAVKAERTEVEPPPFVARLYHPPGMSSATTSGTGASPSAAI